MRIGPIAITWLRRVKGRRELPWEILTADDLNVHTRAAISRIVRGEVKDLLGEIHEQPERLITRHTLRVILLMLRNELREEQNADSDTQQRADGPVGVWSPDPHPDGATDRAGS